MGTDSTCSKLLKTVGTPVQGLNKAVRLDLAKLR